MAKRIRQGDTVEIVSGDDRGLRGSVQQVISRGTRVIIAGANIVKKHQRPVRAGRGQVQPGIIELEAPVHISNVMLVCSHCDEPSRVGFVRDEEGRAVRVCKKCGEAID
jgi:large subunit ribosomal protein L24